MNAFKLGEAGFDAGLSFVSSSVITNNTNTNNFPHLHPEDVRNLCLELFIWIPDRGGNDKPDSLEPNDNDAGIYRR